MRLLHIFTYEPEARAFAAFLAQEHIEYQLDIAKNTDWGSAEYGNVMCKLWIIDEDKQDSARKWLDYFLKNPHDPRFIDAVKNPLPPVQPDEENPIEEKISKIKLGQKPQAVAPITFNLLLLCVILYFFSAATSPKFQPYPSNLPAMPLFSPQIEKVLLYDYPAAYQIIDKAIQTFGLENVLNPDELPSDGIRMLNKFKKTPYWQGYYDKIVDAFRPNPTPQPEAPLFEKIRQGEIWRLFTPALLHYDIFHILFNMIWLLVLGRQMEPRLGVFRYILFILIAALVSNTSQYLMSGADFIGLSGVLCAMITFVWFRQKRAPWEGYQMLPSTMGFITAFILIIAALQIISFILEISGKKINLGTNIANTAHLSGALVGIIFAYSNFFARRN